MIKNSMAGDMKTTRALVGTAPVLLGLAAWLLALPSWALSLQGVEFSAPGEPFKVTLNFDQVPNKVRTTRSEVPPSTRVSIPAASNSTGQSRWRLDHPQLRGVEVTNQQDGLEVMLDWQDPIAVQARLVGNQLEIVPAGLAAEVGEALIFERGEGGQGKIRIMLPDPATSVQVVEVGEQVEVRLQSELLPDIWQQSYTVADYGTAVNKIDASLERKGKGVLKVRPIKGKRLEALTYQDGLELVVEITPKQEIKQQQAVYRGEKIDLVLQNTDVRRVLQLIAESQGKNVLISDGVEGEISVNFQGVRWDEALDMVLRSRKLSKREQNDIWLIGPANELADFERQELEQQKQVQDLAPLEFEYIQINYAKAAELVAILNNEKGGLLSERGSLVADPRTNILLAQDTAQRLERIRQAVSRLDVPVRQVMIEARVIVATEDFSREIGVRWGGGYGNRNSKGNIWEAGGSLQTLTEAYPAISGSGDKSDDDAVINFPEALAVDLGVSTPGASSFGLGFTSSTTLLNLEISAYESDGKVEVLSQPKLVTTDGKKAKVESGKQLPYQTVEDGEIKIEWRPAVLSLEATPQITPDNKVILDLIISKDTKGEEVANGNFAINTNRLETQVLVDNGETLVLGGVFELDTQRSVIKTPLLGDIPYLGNLFKKRVNSEKKAELLIFITPRLVTDVFDS